MASSTTNLDLISSSQASKEITANALFDAESPAALFGRRASTTANLTWGYYGGAMSVNGIVTAIPNGTKTLTNGATNYLEADPTTGNVSVNTSNFTAANIPLYSVVTAGNVVTSYTDFRVASGPSYVPAVTLAATINAAADKNTPIGADKITIIDSTNNSLKTTTFTEAKLFFDTEVPQTWSRLSTTALGNTSLNGTLSATGNTVNVFTGTANVTYHVRALGNGIIVHNASVINVLQGSANISTNAGDTFDVEMITGNTCNIKNYVFSAVGSYVESNQSTYANFPASTTYGDMASITLSPGDWSIDVLCGLYTNMATASFAVTGVGLNPGNNAPADVMGIQSGTFGAAGSTIETGISVSGYRVHPTVTTTYYAKIYSSYSVGVPQYRGRISARRWGN